MEMSNTATPHSAERTAYWDNAKCILIVLVVFGHLLEKLYQYPTSVSSEAMTLHDTIYLFHMPAFILISGFFFGRSNKNPITKIPHFLAPLLVVSALYACLSLSLGTGLGLRLGSPQLGLWYLEFMIYACVIAWFVKPHRDKGPLVPLIAVAVSLCAGMDDSIDSQWSVGRAVFFMPFLIAGMCLDIETVIAFAKRHRMCCVIILIASLVAMYFLEPQDWYNRSIIYGAKGYEELGFSYPLGILLRLAHYCWSAVTTVCFLALVPEKRSFLSSIGQETLDIYLVHTFLIGAFFSLVMDHFSSLPVSATIVIFAVLIAIACPLVIKAHHALPRLTQRIRARVSNNAGSNNAGISHNADTSINTDIPGDDVHRAADQRNSRNSTPRHRKA